MDRLDMSVAPDRKSLTAAILTNIELASLSSGDNDNSLDYNPLAPNPF